MTGKRRCTPRNIHIYLEVCQLGLPTAKGVFFSSIFGASVNKALKTVNYSSHIHAYLKSHDSLCCMYLYWLVAHRLF